MTSDVGCECCGVRVEAGERWRRRGEMVAGEVGEVGEVVAGEVGEVVAGEVGEKREATGRRESNE